MTRAEKGTAEQQRHIQQTQGTAKARAEIMAREGEAQSARAQTVRNRSKAQPRRKARAQAEHGPSTVQALLAGSHQGTSRAAAQRSTSPAQARQSHRAGKGGAEIMARKGLAQPDKERTVEGRTKAQPRRAARAEAEHWHSRAQAKQAGGCESKAEPQQQAKERGRQRQA